MLNLLINSISTLNKQIPYQIAFWGDSNVQFGDHRNGWIDMLRNKYKGKALFFNQGVQGFNTINYLNVIYSNQLDEIQSKKINKIFILLGSNDALYKIETELNRKSRMGVPLEQYHENMQKLVAEAQKYTMDVVLICPPPAMQLKKLREQETLKYVKIVEQVAIQHGLQFIDMRSFGQNPENILYDGLHFNKFGNQLLFEAAKEKIGELKVQSNEQALEIGTIDMENKQKQKEWALQILLIYKSKNAHGLSKANRNKHTLKIRKIIRKKK